MKRLQITVAAVLASGLALAAVPPALLNYEGVLRDSAGSPLTGTHDMVFRFWSSSSCARSARHVADAGPRDARGRRAGAGHRDRQGARAARRRDRDDPRDCDEPLSRSAHDLAS